MPNPGAKKLQTLVGLSLSNLCDYVNPELNELAAELATVSSDTQEAQDLWWQIEKIIVDDTLQIPLLFGSLTGGYDSSKRGPREHLSRRPLGRAGHLHLVDGRVVVHAAAAISAPQPLRPPDSSLAWCRARRGCPDRP